MITVLTTMFALDVISTVLPLLMFTVLLIAALVLACVQAMLPVYGFFCNIGLVAITAYAIVRLAVDLWNELHRLKTKWLSDNFELVIRELSGQPINRLDRIKMRTMSIWLSVEQVITIFTIGAELYVMAKKKQFLGLLRLIRTRRTQLSTVPA